MFFSSEGTWIVWKLLPGMHLVIKLAAEISEQKQNRTTKEGPSDNSLLPGTGNPKSSAWVWWQFVNPAVCSWAEADGFKDSYGRQHLALGSSLPITTDNSPFRQRREAWKISCPEPSSSLNGLLLACQWVACAQGQVPGIMQITKMSFSWRCNGLCGWIPNGEIDTQQWIISPNPKQLLQIWCVRMLFTAADEEHSGNSLSLWKILQGFCGCWSLLYPNFHSFH